MLGRGAPGQRQYVPPRRATRRRQADPPPSKARRRTELSESVVSWSMITRPTVLILKAPSSPGVPRWSRRTVVNRPWTPLELALRVLTRGLTYCCWTVVCPGMDGFGSHRTHPTADAPASGPDDHRSRQIAGPTTSPKTLRPGLGGYLVNRSGGPIFNKPSASLWVEASAVSAAAQSSTPLLRSPPGAIVAARILLVEDSPDNQVLIQSYLKSTSHRIDLPITVKMYAAKFQNGHYDLILMDMQMPVMDGPTATRIRRWNRTGLHRSLHRRLDRLGTKGRVSTTQRDATPMTKPPATTPRATAAYEKNTRPMPSVRRHEAGPPFVHIVRDSNHRPGLWPIAGGTLLHRSPPETTAASHHPACRAIG